MVFQEELWREKIIWKFNYENGIKLYITKLDLVILFNLFIIFIFVK